MSSATIWKYIGEALKERSWPAHLTYEQIVSQWMYEKGIEE